MDNGQEWSFNSLPSEQSFSNNNHEEGSLSNSTHHELLLEQDISDTDLEDYDDFDDDDGDEDEEDGDDYDEEEEDYGDEIDRNNEDSYPDSMDVDETQSEQHSGDHASGLRQGRKRPYQSLIPSDDDEPDESSKGPQSGRKRARIETEFDPDREVSDDEEDFPKETQRRRRPMVFNLLEGIFCDNAVLLNFVIHLDYHSFVNLYAVSRYFHFLINSHMRTFVMYNAQKNYPDAVEIFPWQKYDRLTIKDPLQTMSRQFPGVVRDVPSLRYLGMLSFRHLIVQKIIMHLQLEDHMLPKETGRTILKIWHLLEYPQNRWRKRVIRNQSMWTKEDLFYATTFFMKLDMRFNDPVDSDGSTSLRKLLMYQKSLTQLYKVLSGQFKLTYANLIKLRIMTIYTPDTPSNTNLWGIPADRVGHLCCEGWVQGNNTLIRPDELVMAEAVRRDYPIHKHYLDIMISGYVDKEGRSIVVPLDKMLTKHVLRKKNAGVPLSESELAFVAKMKAKETVAQNIKTKTMQSRVWNYSRRLAAGWPLEPDQVNYLEQTIQQRNRELMQEIQSKMGTGQDLSAPAKRLFEKYIRERATQFSKSHDPRIPKIKFTEADYCDIIVNVLTKRGKEQQLSPRLQAILLSSAVISVVRKVKVAKRLSAVHRRFLVKAGVMLKMYQGEPLNEAEKKLVLHHALDQIKYKDRMSNGRAMLHDEEKVLVLKYFVAGWFTKKIQDGEVLTEEENARFQSYEYDMKEAEQRVMRKVAEEKHARESESNVQTGQTNESSQNLAAAESSQRPKWAENYQHSESAESIQHPETGRSSQPPEVAQFMAMGDEGKREIVQRHIDRLSAKFERGEELTEVEKRFIEKIREGQRLAEKRKGKQRAE